jgi:hypothetical protein
VRQQAQLDSGIPAFETSKLAVQEEHVAEQ